MLCCHHVSCNDMKTMRSGAGRSDAVLGDAVSGAMRGEAKRGGAVRATTNEEILRRNPEGFRPFIGNHVTNPSICHALVTPPPHELVGGRDMSRK